MPRIGEKIGDAYVRIHGSGEGLDRDVRREMRQLDSVMRDVGEDQGEEWQEGFSQGLKKNRKVTGNEILRGIDATLGQLDSRTERITKVMRENLSRSLRESFGDQVGDAVFRDLEKQLVSGRLPAHSLAAMFTDPEVAKKDIDNFFNNVFDKELDSRVAAQRASLERRGEELGRPFSRGFIDGSLEAFKQGQLGEVLALAQKETEEFIKKEQERLAAQRERGVQRLADLRAKHVELIAKAERDADEKARREALRVEEQWQRERARQQKDYDADLARIRKAELDALKADIVARNNARLVELKENDRINTEQLKAFRQFEKDMQSIGARIGAIRAGTPQFADDFDSVKKEVERLTVRLGEYENGLGDAARDTRLLRRELAVARVDMLQTTPVIDRQAASWRQLSDRLGRITGRGSRNNFLNFIGSVNRNLTGALGGAVFGFRRATSTTRAFFDLLRSGQADAETVAELFNRIRSSMNTFATNLAGVAFSFSTLIGLLGVASASLSGLGAILTALVSTISFGLVGGLGALAGALLPVAAGVGAVALAVRGLSDDMKDNIKDAAEPLGDELDKLSDIAAGAVFGNVENQLERLSKASLGWRDAVRGVGEAISRIGDFWLDAIESPGFTAFREAMTQFLPSATEQLGRSLVNTVAGIGGVFRALIPLTQRFLGWLEDITGSFNEFANSDRGQRRLVRFFERAGDSAAVLGDFLGAASGFLGELLGQTRGVGNILFERMADSLQEATEWLTSPEGRQAMGEWAQFALDFGSALGDAFLGVVDLFDALDTPATRAAAIDFFEALGEIFREIGDVATDVINFFDALFDAMSPVLGPIAKGIVNFLRDIPDPAKAAALTIGGLALALVNLYRGARLLAVLTGTSGILRWLGRLGIVAGGAAGGKGGGGIAALTGRLGSLAKVLKVGGISTALFAIYDTISRGGEAVDEGTGFFAGFQERFSGFADTLSAQFQTLAAGIGGDTNKITESQKKAREAAKRIWTGVAANTEAGAARYAEAIQSMVNETFDGLNQLGQAEQLAQFGDILGDRGGDLESLRDAGVSVRELTLALQGNGDALQSIRDTLEDADWGVEEIGNVGKAINETGVQTHGAIKSALEAEIAFQNLGFLFNLLPEKVATQIELDGIVPTAAGLIELREQYDEVDGKVLRSIIETLGIPTSKSQIKEYETLLDNLPEDVKAQINLTNFPATAQDLANLKTEFDSVDNQTLKAIIELTGSDATIADVKKVIASMKLATDSIGDTEVKPPRISQWTSTLDELETTGTTTSERTSKKIKQILRMDGLTADTAPWTKTFIGFLSAEKGRAREGGKGIGESLSTGFAVGITAAAAVAKAREVANQVLGALAGAIAAQSPSRKAADIGNDLSDGFALGIEQAQRDAERASAALGTQSLTGLRRGASRAVTVPEINVYSNASDPRAVAQEVFNHAVAAGY